MIYKYDTASDPDHFDLLLESQGQETLSQNEFKELVEYCVRGENIHAERPVFMSIMDFLLHFRHDDQDRQLVDPQVIQPQRSVCVQLIVVQCNASD